MDFPAILDNIKRLNSSWLNKKLFAFKKEPFYVKEQGKLFIHEGFYLAEEENEETGEIHKYEAPISGSEPYHMGFHAYCWDSHFKGSLSEERFNSWGTDEEYEFDLAFDAKSILSELLNYLQNKLQHFNAIEKAGIINRSLDAVNNELNILHNEDKRYNSLLIYIKDQIYTGVYNKYKGLLEEYPKTIPKPTILEKKGKTCQLTLKYAKYDTNPYLLNGFLSELITKDFIARNTQPSSFKAIFSGKEISEVAPVVWTAEQHLLKYLIDQGLKKGAFINPNKGQVKWPIVVKMFVLKDPETGISAAIDHKNLRYSKGEETPQEKAIIEAMLYRL
jgi:hypothetical protein